MEASGHQHAPAALTYRKHLKLNIEYEPERSSGLVLSICREKHFLPLLGKGKTAVILIYLVISKWF
jgi:TATA-box binding protein (TBP) (component of TFIID and TFIIIB)